MKVLNENNIETLEKKFKHERYFFIHFFETGVDFSKYGLVGHHPTIVRYWGQKGLHS